MNVEDFNCPYCGSWVYVDEWHGWVLRCPRCDAKSEPVSDEIIDVFVRACGFDEEVAEVPLDSGVKVE